MTLKEFLMDYASEDTKKIGEALISALPITLIVYLVALLPWFDFSANTLIAFGIGAVLMMLSLVLMELDWSVIKSKLCKNCR